MFNAFSGILNCNFFLHHLCNWMEVWCGGMDVLRTSYSKCFSGHTIDLQPKKCIGEVIVGLDFYRFCSGFQWSNVKCCHVDQLFQVIWEIVHRTNSGSYSFELFSDDIQLCFCLFKFVVIKLLVCYNWAGSWELLNIAANTDNSCNTTQLV